MRARQHSLSHTQRITSDCTRSGPWTLLTSMGCRSERRQQSRLHIVARSKAARGRLSSAVQHGESTKPQQFWRRPQLCVFYTAYIPADAQAQRRPPPPDTCLAGWPNQHVAGTAGSANASVTGGVCVDFLFSCLDLGVSDE